MIPAREVELAQRTVRGRLRARKLRGHSAGLWQLVGGRPSGLVESPPDRCGKRSGIRVRCGWRPSHQAFTGSPDWIDQGR